jgi:hypothetical protein
MPGPRSMTCIRTGWPRQAGGHPQAGFKHQFLIFEVVIRLGLLVPVISPYSVGQYYESHHHLYPR